MGNLKQVNLFLISSLISLASWANSSSIDSVRHEHHNQVKVKNHDSHDHPSCNRLMDFFHSGHLKGDVRYFFMNTNHTIQNERYYANAIGGRLGFHTAEFHGFSAGLEGIFVYNIGSSHFHDSLITNYEAELFDVTHLENKNDLDRLEELYINYRWKESTIKFGKQDISTPLVNIQDTRMKPYVLRGVWSNIKLGENTTFNGGFFDKASPRSTTHWYSIDEAIGLYEPGFNQSGVPSDYFNHLSSKGMFIGGLTFQNDYFTSQGWAYLIENILATYFIQVDAKYPVKNAFIVLGVQGLYQGAHQQGGNSDFNQTYYHTGQTGRVGSFRFGYQNNHWLATANYTVIDDAGRFIFPREFGREQFYTTIPRGRIEGAGGVSQFVVSLENDHFITEDFSLKLHLGQTNMPSKYNFNINKYGIGSYRQAACDIGYDFKERLEGLRIDLLYVYKSTEALAQQLDPLHDFNFHQFNLIANINF